MFISLSLQCTTTFYALIQTGCLLTSDNPDVTMKLMSSITENGVQKDKYNNTYSGTLNRINVTFTVLCVTSKQYVVEMNKKGCVTGGGGIINISFNSVCPFNSKCSRADDLNMINMRSAIIRLSSADVGVLPTSNCWGNIKRDHDQSYCLQCSDNPEIIDLSNDVPRFEPLVPSCNLATQSCNGIMYQNAGQDQYWNSFLNRMKTTDTQLNGFHPPIVGGDAPVVNQNRRCCLCNGFRQVDDAASLNYLDAIAKGLEVLGGLEEYYQKQDMIFNAILYGSCSGAVVILIVIAVVVYVVRAKKRAAPNSARSKSMKEYVM